MLSRVSSCNPYVTPSLTSLCLRVLMCNMVKLLAVCHSVIFFRPRSWNIILHWGGPRLSKKENLTATDSLALGTSETKRPLSIGSDLNPRWSCRNEHHWESPGGRALPVGQVGPGGEQWLLLALFSISLGWPISSPEKLIPSKRLHTSLNTPGLVTLLNWGIIQYVVYRIYLVLTKLPLLSRIKSLNY